MRALYARRQQILLKSAQEHLADIMQVSPSDAGMHLVGWLPKTVDDIALSAQAARYRIYIIPLSPFYLSRPARKALLLGYTGTPTDQIPSRIRQLATALKS